MIRQADVQVALEHVHDFHADLHPGRRQPGRPPIDAHQIDDSHTLRRLAADGHGIALFFVGLVQDDLRTRQLVQPFDLTVDTGDHYYLTWPRGRPMRPKLATFSHWLRDEIRKQPRA